MKILLIGDIFSTSGREMIEKHLDEIRTKYGINFIVANGENIAHGNGITQNYYKFLLEHHVNVVTLGNHSFSNHDIYNFIDDAKNLIRPINYPNTVPGQGYVTVKYNNLTITVFQVMGRTFMNSSLDCPFQKTEELLKNVKSDLYICDFHGEATSEKIAYGHYFDGKVDIIFGTHTHVQTSDLRIMPNGSAYITDVGMTGPLDGVIGTKKEIILNRFLNDAREVFEPQDTGRKQFCAIIVEISDITHKVTKVDRINVLE